MNFEENRPLLHLYCRNPISNTSFIRNGPYSPLKKLIFSMGDCYSVEVQKFEISVFVQCHRCKSHLGNGTFVNHMLELSFNENSLVASGSGIMNRKLAHLLIDN